MDQNPNTDPTPEKEEEVKVDFRKSSEAKMVMYVVPVALALLIVAWIVSSCGAG
jgi:hypothetical protein